MYKPADFFDGCTDVLEIYKEQIISVYEKRLSENDKALINYKKAKEQGLTKYQKGESIQNHIDYIERDKLFVENRGYKTNIDFGCELDKDGNISQSIFDTKVTLRWYQVEQIEQGLLQAKQKILPIPIDSIIITPKKLQSDQLILIKLPEKVLIFLADNQCENGKSYIDVRYLLSQLYSSSRGGGVANCFRIGVIIASILSHISVSKFIDHLPFYRQTKIFKREKSWFRSLQSKDGFAPPANY